MLLTPRSKTLRTELRSEAKQPNAAKVFESAGLGFHPKGLVICNNRNHAVLAP